MKIPRELKRQWERRFPDLSGKWTHWKITGTGKLLGVVAGADLVAALKVVEDNYGRYITIRAARATADENGQLKEEEPDLFEISNLTNDENFVGSLSGRDA
jgi:hypothetical protein